MWNRLYRQRIKFDHSMNSFFLWNGHYWKADETRQHEQLIDSTVWQYRSAAKEIAGFIVDSPDGGVLQEIDTDGEKQNLPAIEKALRKQIKALGGVNRRRNVASYLGSLVGIVGNEWDANPYLLGVQNGVIDLKTGELRNGKPDDYIRKACPIAFDETAAAPRWEQFLGEIFNGDSDLITFVQRWLGYSITGDTSENKIAIFWGEGRNGKRTLVETIKTLLGEYMGVGTSSLLIDADNRGGGANPDVYNLQGKRLVSVSETGKRDGINAAQVKTITGGDSLTARPLYGNPVTFAPTHKVILQTNYKPQAPADDYALWQRLLLVPFTLSFVDNPQSDNQRQRDPHLQQALTGELAGILNWLLDGCLSWQKIELQPPAAVTSATDDYQREQNTILQFIEERCIENINAKVLFTTFYQAYLTYCHVLNIRPEMEKTARAYLYARYTKDKGNQGAILRGLDFPIPDPK
jgi:putative DNA primase/helicase